MWRIWRRRGQVQTEAVPPGRSSLASPSQKPIARSCFTHSVLRALMGRHGARASHRRSEQMGRLYANILETVGNTPVVKINKLAPPE